MIKKNIYINPNFIKKCQPKIHVNPSFVSNSNDKFKYKEPISSYSENIQGKSNLHLQKLPLIYDGKIPNIKEDEGSGDLSRNRKNISECKSISLSTTEYFVSAPKSNTGLEPNYFNTSKLVSNEYNHSNIEEHSLYKQPYHKSSSKQYYSSDYLKKIKVDHILTAEIGCHSSKNVLISNIKPKNPPTYFNTFPITNKDTYANKFKYSVDKRKTKYNFNDKQSMNTKFLDNNNGIQNSLSNCHVEQRKLLFDPEALQKVNTSKYKVNRSFHKVYRNASSISKIKSNTQPLNSSIPSSSNTQDLNNSNMKKLVPISSSYKIDKNLVSNKKPIQSKATDVNDGLYKSRTKLATNCSDKNVLTLNSVSSNKTKYPNKSRYAVQTKTKLIRRISRNSESSPVKYVSFNNPKLSNTRFRKSLSIKKGSLLKAKERMVKKYISPKWNMNHKYISPINKYKLINKAVVISKYKVKRFHCKKKVPLYMTKYRWSPKYKRSKIVKKSDKFINIGGNLYKSTRTSLKKQELSGKINKKRKSISPKIKPKRTSLRSSKFVYRRQLSTNLESGTLIEIVRRKKLAKFKRVNDFCFFFAKYGKCKKENKGCPFIHDPDRIAICTRYLQGSCSKSDCPFSHVLDKNKMPVCSHFLEGSCNNEFCNYRHIRVNPKAPFCSNFLKGLCPQGDNCKKKHILICEEFRMNGECPRGKKCPLSHKKATADNTQKKEKCLKKANKRSKIGILGLDNRVGKASSPKASVTTRYFEDREANDVLTSDPANRLMDDSLTPEVAGTAAGTCAWEEKRKRLFKKVETLKKNYNVGVDFEDLAENVSESEVKVASPIPENHGDGFQPCASRFRTLLKSEERAKLRFIPLPDKLPSYIPLITVEETD